MKKTFSLLIWLFSSHFLNAQVKILGEVFTKSIENNYVYLYEITELGEPDSFVDSILINPNGKFNYDLPSTFSIGTLFKLRNEYPTTNINFPDNAIIFSNTTANVICFEIPSFQEFYKTNYKKAVAENVHLSKIQKQQSEYFEILKKIKLEVDKNIVRDKYFPEIQNFQTKFNSFLSNLVKTTPTLPVLYFYLMSNQNNIDNKIIDTAKIIQLPNTSLGNSVIKKLAFINNNVVKNFSTINIGDNFGKIIPLNSLFTNKYTVIDFWASWCGPCRNSNIDEVPKFINKIAKNKQINFVAISIDLDATKWKKAQKKDNITWESYILKNPVSSIMPSVLNGNGVPFYNVVNSNGDVVFSSGSLVEIENYIFTK